MTEAQLDTGASPQRLDDLSAVASADPERMLTHVAALGKQLVHGFDASRLTHAFPSADDVSSVLVCGMGGSGVAGDILSCLFSARLPMPLMVRKGYGIPEFCGKDTLVLAVSFSGDTEETLTAYEQALRKGCRVVTITGGGELAKRSLAEEVPSVEVPDDVPAPRAALGYLAGASIGVLDAMGLIPPAAGSVGQAAGTLDELASRLGPHSPCRANEAKSLAAWVAGRTPVVWGSEGLAEAAALRWKTQINENAKLPAFHSVLSELDHNEVEGWSAGTGAGFAAIVLRHGLEHPRTPARVRATLDAIGGSSLEAREARADGSGPMEILLSLVMLGDFFSTYLAILRGVDPTPVRVLTRLKERLRQ